MTVPLEAIRRNSWNVERCIEEQAELTELMAEIL